MARLWSQKTTDAAVVKEVSELNANDSKRHLPPLALVPLARQLLELARKSAGLPLPELGVKTRKC
jgi:hypothetical protein